MIKIKDILYNRQLNRLSAKEKAKVSFESMCVKVNKGKPIEKIFFHVVDSKKELKEVI